MIGDIRSYFRDSIKSVDPDLIENPSAFYLGDIGENIIERSFQLEINDINNTVRSSHTEDEITVDVYLFGFGYRDEIANYDSLLDKAICMRDNIMNIKNFTGKFDITNITAGSILSEQLPGNDNGFKITTNYTLSIAYLREE